MRSIVKLFAIAWFALGANCLVSAQKTSRKLIGNINNCDAHTEAPVNESCHYAGTSIRCPNGQRPQKEGWCFWGGRTWKCYQKRCKRCSDGYYKANELRCNACSTVDNCKIGSVTCSSLYNSVCTSCKDGFSLENGKCNPCEPIDDCLASTCKIANESICVSCRIGYFEKDNKCTKCEQLTPFCLDGYLSCTNSTDSKCNTECGAQMNNVTTEDAEDKVITPKVELELSFNEKNANATFVCKYLDKISTYFGVPGYFDEKAEFEIGVGGLTDKTRTLKDDCKYTDTNAFEGQFAVKPCGNNTISASLELVKTIEKQCQTCGDGAQDNCPYLQNFNEENIHELLGREGCTTMTNSYKGALSIEMAQSIGEPEVLSNIAGFELGWNAGIGISFSYGKTKPHPTSEYSDIACDGNLECSSEVSKTMNIGIVVSAGIEAQAQLQIAFKGYILAGVGASGAVSFEVGGDINLMGDTRVCFTGKAQLELKGFVKIFWFKLSITVIGFSFNGYLGICNADYPNRYWHLERDGDLYPKFKFRNKRILRPALTEHGWRALIGTGKYHFDVMPTQRFNSIWRNSNKILRRKCYDCIPSHQDLYYRRMNESEDIEEIDLIEIIKEYFNSGETTSHNVFEVDFNLYSTYEDALSNTNSWKYCDIAGNDDEIVGFPSNCSPSKNILVEGQWNLIADPSNVAYRRPASSSVGSNVISLTSIQDGMKVAEDESESYHFEPGSYITIDLEENAKISYILLYFTNADYNFEIEVLDDVGNPTNEKVSYMREQVYSWPERIELPAEGRFVRIYNKDEKFITLVEVEVFGVLTGYSRSASGGQQNVVFYVEIGATNCILYDPDRMAVIVENNEILTDADLMGCDDVDEEDLTWNDEELTCEGANHGCGFLTTLSGTKDCGSCPGGSFCGATDDLTGTRCQCLEGVQVCQRTGDGRGQIGFCEVGDFRVIEECKGSCTYDERGQPSCAKTCGSTSGSSSALDAIRTESQIDYEYFVSFRTSNNDRITCWFSEYEEDTDYRFGEGETIESCQETCMNDETCVGIEFIPDRASGRPDCALWLEGACFSEDSPGRFVCPNARTDTFVRIDATCAQEPCLTMLDASDVETEGYACDEQKCWDDRYHFKHCRTLSDCDDGSYCLKMEGSPFRVCVDQTSREPIISVEPPTELPTETRPTEFPTKTSRDKKSNKSAKKKKKNEGKSIKQ